MTQPCATAHDEVLKHTTWHSSPYVLPPVQLSDLRTSRDCVELSVVALQQQTLNVCQLRAFQQLLPPIIHLPSYVSSAYIPTIERMLSRAFTENHNMPFCIILDFSAVTAVETCVARFLARQALKLAHQDCGRYFIVVGATVRSAVNADLSRGGFDLCWSRDSLIEEQQSTSCSPTLACDNLEQTLRMLRYRNCRESLTSRPTYNVQQSPCIVIGLDDTFALRFLSQLQSFLPYPDIRTDERLMRCGLHIRKITQGRAIACRQYAGQSVFIVLYGEVMIQSFDIGTARTRALKPVSKVFKDTCNSLLARSRRIVFRENRKPEGGPSNYVRLARLGMYSRDIYPLSCAHVLGNICWILDVNPQNDEGMAAVARYYEEQAKL